MFKDVVVLKGIKNGIMAVLDADAPFELICKQATEKLAEVMEFFKSGSNRLLFSGRNVGAMERIKLEQAVMEILPSNVTIEYQGDYPALSARRGLNGDRSKFYYGTVRSGQSIKSLGNLVVVGDVNPGAELIAVGDVVVMGCLRGIVHAGCNGDKSAVVSAVKMAPTQLRIADIITRPPDNETDESMIPEIAYIKDGNIYIDDYLSRKIIR